MTKAAVSKGSSATLLEVCKAARDNPSRRVDPHEDLDSILWQQTAAEYRANATTVYRAAAAALHDLVAAKGDGKPPVAVLDLDETVFDNSDFQGQLVRDRRSYTEDAWREWVRARLAGAVPGAQAFIEAAQRRGIQVYFVSNRAAADEESTIANLRALGIDSTGERLLSPGENGWTADKSARRAAVAERHRVLMLVGDDLGDFVTASPLTLEQRAALVAQYRDRWLERWILLPNPSYGSWSRSLTPGLSDEVEVLQRKLATVRGYR
jgi:acid phosphatase